MTDVQHIQGRLLAIHWPSQEAEATLSVDLNQCQVATAEIEDTNGTVHRVKAHLSWDADSLVGKVVKTSIVNDATSLVAVE
ncbi:MAG: hypothetical protein QGI78_04040 [Phycisphaerales bacterium]|jgi:hypothetical protein|nr:hypothetical protein [Phycisphaerales bacterium]